MCTSKSILPVAAIMTSVARAEVETCRYPEASQEHDLYAVTVVKLVSRAGGGW